MKSLFLVLSLMICTEAMVANEARAEVLPADRILMSKLKVPESIWCVILLPICLLNEDLDLDGAVGAAELKKRNYSEKEIQEILKTQSSLQQRLRKKNRAIHLGAENTRESIVRDIRSMDPGVPASYVKFVTEFLGVRK